MSRRFLVAGTAAMLTGLAAPAAAGGWGHPAHAPHTVVVIHAPSVPWHQQPPVAGTGPAHYYGHHPHHAPGYPRRLSGHAVPVFPAPRPLPVPVYRAVPAAHVAWCARRYRSYDAHTNTFQPYHGPRRACRSPYG